MRPLGRAEFPRFHAEAEDYVELDYERVLVLAHSQGRGKASGDEYRELDRERGLADLGLASEAGRPDS